MGMKFSLYNIPLFILLLLAYPVWAKEPLTPIDFKGEYALSFAGIPFGKMDIAITQSPSSYSMQSDIASTGVADVFAKHSSHTNVTAKGKNFKYTSRSYQSHSQTRKKQRDISLEYKDDRLVMEKVLPPDNRENRKELPVALKNSAYDPLSIIIKIRQEIITLRNKAANVHSVDFPINLYDGRRLTQANVSVHERQMLSVGDIDVPVIHVSIKRKLIAGFTDKELSQYDPNEPPLNLYFSDDEKFLPLRLSIPFTFGSVMATLVK